MKQQTKEERQMKIYETPVIEITTLSTSDIITTSAGDTPVYEYAW
jgi:hypothetical protein